MAQLREFVSVSQILKYTGCSWRYYLSYETDAIQTPAAWLAQGSAFHKMVEDWEIKGRPEADLFEGYKFYYDQFIADHEQVMPKKLWLKSQRSTVENDIENRRNAGQNFASNYLAHKWGNLWWFDEYTPGIEFPFQVEIQGVKVRGIIDRIESVSGDNVAIFDLKTGNREAAKLQLGFYKVALEKELGVKVVSAGFWYAKDDKMMYLTDADLARYTEIYVGALLQKFKAGVENDVFIPNISQSCFLCPVNKYCSEYSPN